ncbi:MAG: peptidase MA family metallohydrolase [Candidatus Orphnella occulta]|nr:peptidase MA family metallohydrolase [Candidatus Orphnella occulta]
MKKKRLTLVIALAFILLSIDSSLYAQDEEWDIKKSKHFIVYHREVPTEYVSEVIREAEKYYKSIIDYLGFGRSIFWTWENRCKIYLYSSREQYLEMTNAKSWSAGKVHVIRKEIATHAKNEQFLDYVLPHEMGHIIFREAIGFDTYLPLWIDEGIAILQEKDRTEYLLAAKKFIKQKSFIPLYKLVEIKSYVGSFPCIFYSESASIMEFLIKKFNKRKFVSFCHSLQEGTDWKEALLKIYKFKSLKELEEAWIKDTL